MSLKTFHIVFIAVSTLVMFLFGVWAIFRGMIDSSSAIFAGGIVALLGGVGLIYYGVRFIRKLKAASIY